MSDDTKTTEIVDISQLVGKFKNRVELQRYAELLFKSFKETVEQLKVVEAENTHLKTLLAELTPEIPTATKLVVPDEQAIAEIQLKKLKETAMDRELTLDETKRYDLLTKNLYLAKGKPSKPVDTEKVPEVTEAELIEMAKNKNE